MAVVHLARPTMFPRKNISAANIVCQEFPDNEKAHKIIWGLIASSKHIIEVEALRSATIFALL